MAEGSKETPVVLGTNPKDLIGSNKVPLWLVPPAATIYTALGFWDGAVKYGPYNWRKNKVLATVYISALGRHLLDYLDGEDNAQDSGYPHVAHMLACGAILADATETGNLVDDRPTKGAAAALMARWDRSRKRGDTP